MAALSSSTDSTRKERLAWYFYDFGNSAYAAVVLLAVYSAYFQNGVVGGDAGEGTRLWGYAVGIAMLVVAVISPILGTIADYSGSKKRFLLFFTALSCTFTAFLFFVQQGDILIGMLFFILAEIGYRASQVFYNALLPEIAAPEDLGRVSGNGWAIGSIGGIICLLIVLPLIVLSDSDNTVVRATLVITAVFYAVSAAPLFLFLNERAEKRRIPAGSSTLSLGFKRLAATARKAKNYKEYLKFLLSFIIFHDGVMMALNFASIIGAVLYGFDQTQLIVLIIIVQVTNAIGAYIFGIWTQRSTIKSVLTFSIILMIVAVVWLYFNQSPAIFYVIGTLTGFAMAGIQSLSRTMVGALSPKGQSAEFFGLFAVAGRSSSFIGPTLFGILAAEATQWYLTAETGTQTPEQLGHRLAILSIVAFLFVGLMFLLWVDEERGVKEAQG